MRIIKRAGALVALCGVLGALAYPMAAYGLSIEPPPEAVDEEGQDAAAVANPFARSFVITLGGDCVLGVDTSWKDSKGTFDEAVDTWGFGHPFSGISPVLMQDDMTLVNLEGPLTHSEDRQQKKYTFRGSPAYVSVLQMGGVEAVNIANNHILDYGQGGMEDTVAALEQAGLTVSGKGKLGVFEKAGIRVGMAGYTYPFAAKGLDISGDMQALREMGCHIVLASFHWGSEYRTEFTAEQRKLGRAAIDAGADAVIGHHPHVIQGIERYKDRYIIYSLGNLVSGGIKNPRDSDSFLAQLIFTVDTEIVAQAPPPTLHLLPLLLTENKKVNYYKPTFPEEHESDRILQKIRRLSYQTDF